MCAAGPNNTKIKFFSVRMDELLSFSCVFECFAKHPKSHTIVNVRFLLILSVLAVCSLSNHTSCVMPDSDRLFWRSFSARSGWLRWTWKAIRKISLFIEWNFFLFSTLYVSNDNFHSQELRTFMLMNSTNFSSTPQHEIIFLPLLSRPNTKNTRKSRKNLFLFSRRCLFFSFFRNYLLIYFFLLFSLFSRSALIFQNNWKKMSKELRDPLLMLRCNWTEIKCMTKSLTGTVFS